MRTPRPAWPAGGPDALEREVLQRWQREALFDRVQEATAAGEPWVFFEGPPTANGRPGIHHDAEKILAQEIDDQVIENTAIRGKQA